MSDQLVNFHKAAFQCTKNVRPDDCLVFNDILVIDNALSLGNYLDCPIIDSHVNKNTFGEIVDKYAKQFAN